MAARTISTSTLGLRFMQNAQRAKQLKEVEVESAPVKDDAEWEVDQKVRDAWGPVPSTSRTISQESSYLPFLFSSGPSTSEADHKPKGRRVFNKHGAEEVQKEKEPEPTPTSTPDDHKRPKVHPRPKSISGGSGHLFGFPEKRDSKRDSKPRSTKSAKQAIYDNAGVGEDLRRAKLQKLETTSAKPTFLKPSGVDDPHDVKPPSSGATSSAHDDGDVIQGARSKKVKRERSSTDQPEGEETKRKKKKMKRAT
ncbi:putative M-phase phosphoprotein 6 [Lyophyllum shimeji]|uniref:M-phase phosphoprotein 6 n=1 Tax=Lyophyllum shimeji TaxID=47721 RepID=A0A9P3UU91_LYOSH|nr:putative M-phase phosphoprotein 6 [Lyophyllum shimeji]